MHYGSLGTRREITLRRIPQNLTNERTAPVRQWLGAIGQQTITLANVDPDICRHMASLGQNGLIKWAPESAFLDGTLLQLNIFILFRWFPKTFH